MIAEHILLIQLCTELSHTNIGRNYGYCCLNLPNSQIPVIPKLSDAQSHSWRNNFLIDSWLLTYGLELLEQVQLFRMGGVHQAQGQSEVSISQHHLWTSQACLPIPWVEQSHPAPHKQNQSRPNGNPSIHTKMPEPYLLMPIQIDNFCWHLGARRPGSPWLLSNILLDPTNMQDRIPELRLLSSGRGKTSLAV